MEALKITNAMESDFIIESMREEASIDYNHLNTAYRLMMNKTTQSICSIQMVIINGCFFSHTLNNKI